MNAQIVVMKDGTKHEVPMKASYDKLALVNDNGLLLWKQDAWTFPHENVSCILVGELKEKEAE
jgi:hypothetical protein